MTARLALVLLTLPLAASRAHGPDAVAVAAEAATAMRALWNASVAVHTELVGCLAQGHDGHLEIGHVSTHRHASLRESWAAVVGR